MERGADGAPVVYVFELDPATGAYTPSCVAREQLKVTVPFDITLDLSLIRA